jgi:hypothetical protein
MTPPTNRGRLQRAIIRIANRAVRGGEAPNVDAIAIRLSSRYPQSGMTLEAIVAEIQGEIAKRREAGSTGHRS